MRSRTRGSWRWVLWSLGGWHRHTPAPAAARVTGVGGELKQSDIQRAFLPLLCTLRAGELERFQGPGRYSGERGEAVAAGWSPLGTLQLP